jgi:hypothetical protein
MAKVLEMPRHARGTYVASQLRRQTIEGLSLVRHVGGDAAFDQAATDLVISICAILRHEYGRDAVADHLFDVIERVLEGQP